MGVESIRPVIEQALKHVKIFLRPEDLGNVLSLQLVASSRQWHLLGHSFLASDWDVVPRGIGVQ